MNIDKGYTLNFIEELLDRGFDGNAWLAALLEEDAEKITLTHPANWMTEEEIETPCVIGILWCLLMISFS